MKKLLILLLLLANICSGTAFAWDNYSRAVIDHDSSIAGMALAAGQHPSSDVHVNDHCAHGAAHLVGIFYNTSLSVAAVCANHHVAARAPLTSRYISPLLRPPIV